MLRRNLKWLALGFAALLLLPVLLLLWSLLFGFNWARAPLQDWALRQTGRVLLINGDLDLLPAWPLPRVRAQGLSFANPAWSAAPQMVVAETVELSINLPQLLRGRLAIPEAHLLRPRLFLEQAPDGRKNWLLDRAQSDEEMRLPIDRLLLDQGQIHYLAPLQQTALVVDLSTVADASPHSLRFEAQGQFRGQALSATGSGGAVLAWRDQTHPYPLQLQATLDQTRLQASGSITSLFSFSAVDLQLKLSGTSLATLFPIIGVALPPTPAYRSSGQLLRSGSVWRYQSFTGQVGRSDIAGTLQVDTAPARPLLSGSVRARQLALADLGPAVGVRAEPSARVLPDLPFDTARWAAMDADVTIEAAQLLREQALPVAGLSTRVRLQDRRLTLDPLGFALAGGQFKASLVLDARSDPLRGQVSAQLRGLELGLLLPRVDLRKAGIGRLDGEIELQGRGASVGRLLATADGQLSLSARDGRISRLLMEQTGLHLLEILRLNLSGDKTVAMHCALADFKVSKGVMQVRTLVLDTEVNTLVGSGGVDLAQERLDLTIVPRTKVVSVIALRSPIYITGSFAKPELDLDRGRIAMRGLGALVLGLVNPLLALVPLLDVGPGVDDGCRVRQPTPAVPAVPSQQRP